MSNHLILLNYVLFLISFFFNSISVFIMDIAYFPPYWNEFIFNLSSTGKKHNKFLETLHNFTKKIILERNSRI